MWGLALTMKSADSRRLGCAALALSLFTASAVPWACGFHTRQNIAQTVLNLHYPEALHVSGAVWSAQQAGLLPLDRKRLQATGSERELRESRAYLETLRALFALGASFERLSPGAADLGMAVVLTETMLWTQYHPDGEIEPHVRGPERDDLVIVTDEPVVRAIASGRLSVSAAMDKGLIRLYGQPAQERDFVERYGSLGASPLPAADETRLLHAMFRGPRSAPDVACVAGGDCGSITLDAPPVERVEPTAGRTAER